MTPGRAGIQRIKLAIDDSIESHRAGTRTNHRGENQTARSPTGPAAIVTRRHCHCGECERQCKDRMRETNERSPFLNGGKHYLTQRRKEAKTQRKENSASAPLHLCTFALNVHSFSSD